MDFRSRFSDTGGRQACFFRARAGNVRPVEGRRIMAIRTITEFPRRVRTIDTEWIVLADGTRLAATIWLPDDAEQSPVPAILEYLPYRRRDGTVLRDRQMHAYFAGHSY